MPLGHTARCPPPPPTLTTLTHTHIPSPPPPPEEPSWSTKKRGCRLWAGPPLGTRKHEGRHCCHPPPPPGGRAPSGDRKTRGQTFGCTPLHPRPGRTCTRPGTAPRVKRTHGCTTAQVGRALNGAQVKTKRASWIPEVVTARTLNHVRIRVPGTFLRLGQFFLPRLRHTYSRVLWSFYSLVSFLPCSANIMSQGSISIFFGTPVQLCHREKCDDVLTAILYVRFQDRWSGKNRQGVCCNSCNFFLW